MSCRDINRVVIPHFEKHPLYAKKARDFVIWRTAVELLVRIELKSHKRGCGSGRGFPKTWTPDDREEFKAIIAALRESRQFNAPAVLPPISSPPRPNGQGRLFEA